VVFMLNFIEYESSYCIECTVQTEGRSVGVTDEFQMNSRQNSSQWL